MVGFLARDLEVGDLLKQANGELTQVEAIEIEQLESPVKLYNFEVADWQTYFVSEYDVLVHNPGSNTCAKTLVEAGEGTGQLLDDDLAKMYKNVQEGIGSTGRTIPKTLEEQLVMKQVLSNPLEGADDLSKYITLSDTGRWVAKDGWIKMQRIMETSNGIKINIRFNYNKITGAFDDFKFKNKR